MSSSLPASPVPSSVAAHIDVLKLRIAARVAPARWSAALEQLADAIESGETWESAIRDPNWRSSIELRSLVEAAFECGRPADITLNLLQRRAQTMFGWRELMSALVYPLVTLVFALLIASVTGWMMMSVVDFEIGWNIENASLSIIKDFQGMAIGTTLATAWLFLILLTARLLATPNAWLKIVGSLPWIGRPYRWLIMSDMLSRLAVISQIQPALPQALRMTGHSYAGQAPQAIASRLAERVEKGLNFQQALHQSILSDDRAGVALTLIDMDESNFSQSVDRTSNLLEQMARYMCDRLKIVLPLFVLLMIASLIWSAWSCYISVFSLLSRALSF